MVEVNSLCREFKVEERRKEETGKRQSCSLALQWVWHEKRITESGHFVAVSIPNCEKQHIDTGIRKQITEIHVPFRNAIAHHPKGRTSWQNGEGVWRLGVELWDTRLAKLTSVTTQQSLIPSQLFKSKDDWRLKWKQSVYLNHETNEDAGYSYSAW